MLNQIHDEDSKDKADDVFEDVIDKDEMRKTAGQELDAEFTEVEKCFSFKAKGPPAQPKLEKNDFSVMQPDFGVLSGIDKNSLSFKESIGGVRNSL